ncbi:MAG TPA: hypothetical protein IAC46_04795, partial [Candidatus Onthoplasma faecigallinarum]|nr:hypothetical protein [Candidatus Onthoplasma faecigallinarum]
MIYRKSKFIILTTIILLSVLAVSFAVIPVFNSDKEAAANTVDTFEISDLDTLIEFRDLVNSGQFTTGRAYLTADITLSSSYADEGTTGFGIGNYNTPFRGTFDGQGYKISGFNISLQSYRAAATTSGTIGFFGAVSNATIQNLWFDSYTVWVGPDADYNGNGQWSNFSYNNERRTTNWVGGLVGYVVSGSYLNCTNILATGGEVTAVDTYWALFDGAGNQYAGGLVGYADGTVNLSNVEVRCNVRSVADAYSLTVVAGGVVGYCNADSTFTNCYFSGIIVTGTEDNDTVGNYSLIGGIVGHILGDPGSGAFIRCTATLDSLTHNVGIDERSAGDMYPDEQLQTNAVCGAYSTTDTSYVIGQPTGSYTNCISNGITTGTGNTGKSNFQNLGWTVYNDDDNIAYYNDIAWYMNSANTTKINDGYPIQIVFLLVTQYTLVAGEGGSATVTLNNGTVINENQQIYYSGTDECDRVMFERTSSSSTTYFGQNFLAEADDYYEFDRWNISEEDSTITAIFSRLTSNAYINKVNPDENTTAEITIEIVNGRRWYDNDYRHYYSGLETGTIFEVADGELTIIYVDNSTAKVTVELSGPGENYYEVSGWQYRIGSNGTDQDLTSNVILSTRDLYLTPVFDLREYDAEFSVTSNGTNALGGILLDGGVEYDLSETYTFVYGATLIRDNMSITITQPEGFEDRASLTLTASPGNGYS